MKKLFLVVMCWILTANSAFSQAVPVSRIQSALSGVIQQKALKRGFAANDPRYIGTIKDVSAGIAGTAASAATITAIGVTAPAWITFAVAAGVGTLVSYGVYLAIDGTVKWLFKSNSVDIPGTDGQIDSSNGMVKGGPHWVATASRYVDGKFLNSTIYSADGLAAGLQAASAVGYPGPVTCTSNTAAISVTCTTNGSPKSNAYFQSSGAPDTCAKGTMVSAGTAGCSPFNYPYTAPGATPAQTDVPLQTAVTALPVAELQKPLNPEVLANVANAAWRNAAAQPGYQGLPYAASDPITASEVAQWRTTNPDRYPTVGDAVAPQPSANSPWQLPISPTATSQTSGSYPSTGTNPAADQPLTNLGPDPAVGAPTLEEPPTAEQILKPVFDMLPGFKDFSVPSHASECPKPSFNLFERQFVMDSQCTIAENNRALIASLMGAVWVIVGVFIVLKA